MTIRPARLFLAVLLVMAPLHVGCSAVLGYEDDYGVGGATASTTCDAGAPKYRCVGAEIVQICNTASSAYETISACSAPDRCDAATGACVSSGGGNAGRGGAGGTAAGASQGGNAGSAGATQGGNGGTSQGGSAGTGPGGNAGAGGNGGSAQGGNAGTTQGGGGGGNAGSTQGGGAGTQGGGGNGGTSPGGGAGGSAGGPIDIPTDCTVLYVSPSAKAEGDGCSPDTAFTSLAAALGATQPQTKEIRLCAMAVTAPTVTLTVPVSIRGSYDCTDWSRPAKLDVAKLTTHLTSSAESAALIVNGSGIGRATIIDGIHFIGGHGGKKSRGLSVTGGAKPHVRFNHVEGGKGTGDDFPSLGMQISVGAAPRVENNTIEGGAGTTTAATVASVGLLLSEDVGDAEIVGNVLRGGQATLSGKGYGSVGLFVLPSETAILSNTAAIVDNVIVGGPANDTANTVELLSIGLFLDETSEGSRGNVQVRGGSIRGGTASHSGAPANGRIPTGIGIHSGKHKTLEITNVRIYGGDSSERTGSGIAVSLGGPGTTVIRSSVLHGGGTVDTTPSPRAIETRQLGTLSVYGSTLFTGIPRAVSGGSASAKGIYASGEGALDLRANLFVFQAGQATAIQLENTCALPAGGGSLLRQNAFVFSRKADQRLFSGTGCGNGVGETMANLTELFGGGDEGGGNFRVSPDPKESGDVALSCDEDQACVAAALRVYDAASQARSQILDLGRADFGPVSCVVGKGRGLFPGLGTDLAGVSRQATGTIGAIELSPSMCP